MCVCVCVYVCVYMCVYIYICEYIKICIMWALLGKMFRVKLDLPEWKADEDIARHLLKLVCETFNTYTCACIFLK